MRTTTLGCLLSSCLLGVGATEASAQSCMSTFFVSNNGGVADWGNFMDLTVHAPGGITITDLEVNDKNGGTGGGLVAIDVWVTPTSYLGQEHNASAWTLLASGTGIAQPENTPTPIDVSDAYLAAGSYGVFVHHRLGGGPAYTSSPGSGLQWPGINLTLDMGTSMSGLFTGNLFTPRIWNGTFCHTGGTNLWTYCSAKTNSLGCVPVLSGTGVPSASATSGFRVECARVRNGKAGLLMIAANGSTATLPFQCGTLCIGPSSVRRSPSRSSGGNPPPANDCSGRYGIDLNAFAAGLLGGQPDPALRVAGTAVFCQWWGRDPGFPAPCDTSLSDAGAYTIQP